MKARLIFLVALSLWLRATAFAQDFWVQTNGPYGGQVQAIVFDAESRLFAGTAGGGVFRSLDQGDHWTPINQGLTKTLVLSLVVDATGIVYAGTWGGGAFRSADHGDSWTAVNNGLMNTTVNWLTTNPDRHVFAATQGGGVFRTVDGGQTWAEINAGLSDRYVNCIAISATGQLFAGTRSGLFRSVDSGASWQKLDNGAPTWQVESLLITAPGVIFAGAGAPGGGVYRSSDGGETWERLAGDLLQESTRAMAADTAETIYLGTERGLYRSLDHGETWEKVGFENAFVLSVAVEPDGTVLVGVDNDGIFRSRDGAASWEQILANNFVRGLAVGSRNDLYAGAMLNGVFRSTDRGEVWSRTGLVAPMDVYSIAIAPGDTVFVGSSTFLAFGLPGGVYRSANDGASWTHVGLSDREVLSLAVNSKGDLFAGTQRQGVHRSAVSGGSWTSINTGLTNATVCALAVAQNDVLLAGTHDGVFRSTDNGVSWRPTTLKSTVVSSIAVGPSGELAAASTGGVFGSTDGGETWTDIGQRLRGVSSSSVVIHPSGDLFAGTFNNGVFRWSKNRGRWIEVNSGLAERQIRVLVIDQDGYLYAGTYGSGVFRSLQPIVTAVEGRPDGGPSSYALEQNYPNPFNPRTTIRYRLAISSRVTLVVFDLLGQRVRTLVDEHQSAGPKSVVWDGRDDSGNAVTSGVYFYRLRARDVVLTRKMVFVQ